MKRELPAGAEKRCFVRSSFCFSDFEKLLLTTNTPIGIQGGNSVKKLEEFLELGRNEEGHHAGMRRQEQKAFRLPCVNRVWKKASQKQNRTKSLYPVSIVPDFAEKTSAYLKVTWFPKDTNGLRN